MKPIIFLDMDGVIVDFINGALQALNVDPLKVEPNGWDIENWGGVNVSSSKFWGSIDSMGDDFWANLKKHEYADFLVSELEKRGELYLLTSPSKNPSCYSGKMKWVNTHFPSLSRKTIINAHKFLCAGPNRYLIDDLKKNIDKFEDYGGCGVHFKPEYKWTDKFFTGGDPVKAVATLDEYIFIRNSISDQ